MKISKLMVTFLRFFFYLIYQPLAWSYDLVAALVSANRWKDWVRSSAAFLTGSEVLELGHGPGHLQEHMVKLGYAPFGLDLSRQMGKLAQRRLTRLSAASHLVRGNGRALPFSNGSFDNIVATFPTEYIMETVTLREAYRVLRPDGRMIILASVNFTGNNVLDKALTLLYRITGQGQPDHALFARAIQHIQSVGFSTHMEWVEMRNSKILFALLEKRQGQ